MAQTAGASRLHPPSRALRVVFGAMLGLIALLFLNSPGTADVSLFMRWMDAIVGLGLVEGFKANHTVQPPLYAVIFWLVGTFAKWLRISPFLAYKLSLLVAWLLTAVCLRQWTRRTIIIGLILLALIPNSLALGYFDIYLVPPLLFALWAAREERWALFSASFAVFALIKAQGLIVAPFAAIFAAKVVVQARRTERPVVPIAIAVIGPAAAIGALVFAVFGSEVLTAVRNAVGSDFFSGNALNVCWMITHALRWAWPDRFGGLRPDGTAQWMIMPLDSPLAVAMRTAFALAYGAIVIAYLRQTAGLRDFVFYALLGFLAYFVLNVGVHENHLIYGAVLAVVLYLIDASYVAHAAICMLAANVNMILFYGLTGRGLPFDRVVGIDLAVVLAALNVAFFVIAVAPAFRRQPVISNPPMPTPPTN